MPSLPELAAEPRWYRVALFLLLLIAGLNLGLNLDQPQVPGIHEMRVLETAREMHESGNYVIPYFNGETRLQKPPLPYWGSALAFSIVGEPSAAAARVVVALLGLLTLVATFWIARAQEEDPVIAVASVAILTSLLLFLTEFRTVTTNSYLAAMVTTSVAAFVWSMRRSDSAGHLLLLIGYFCLGLALMSKGPIALVFVVLGVWFLRPTRFQSGRRSWLLHGIGIFIALLPLLLWVALVVTRLDNAFDVWRFEVIGRLSGTLEGDRPFWFYGPVLLGAEAPLLVLFIAALFKRDGQPNPSRAWFLSGMLFLMLLSTRSAAYILPLLPAAAILTARYTLKHTGSGAARWVLGAQVGLNLAMGAALLGIGSALGLYMHGEDALLFLFLGGITLILAYLGSRRILPIGYLLLSAVMVTGYYQTVIKSGIPKDMSLYNFGTLIRNIVPADEPLLAVGRRESRIGFFAQRTPKFVDSSEAALAGEGPRWVLSSGAPVVDPTKPHGPEFRTKTHGGTEYFLYRIP